MQEKLNWHYNCYLFTKKIKNKELSMKRLLSILVSIIAKFLAGNEKKTQYYAVEQNYSFYDSSLVDTSEYEMEDWNITK